MNWPISLPESRALLARKLKGRGVEVGPGHQPFPVSDDAEVIFVDRWRPAQARGLFPELIEMGLDDGFPEPDVIADFDRDRLAPLADASQDFVICSHVLEHLAEPLGFLADVHRVLRMGGLAVILLPDRRRTFDRPRDPTPLQHLVDEHEAGVTEVSEAHLEDFLLRTERDTYWSGIPENPGERAPFLEWHRRRSIHVHCWSELEFLPVLIHSIGELGLRWAFIDGTAVDDQGSEGIEFGYLIRRSPEEMTSAERAERFRADYEAWYAERTADHRRAKRQAAERRAFGSPSPPDAQGRVA